MSTEEKPYVVIAEVHKARWEPDLQTTVEGWEVTNRWKATGTIIPTFVPDSRDLVAGNDILVRAAGAQIDALRGVPPAS